MRQRTIVGFVVVACSAGFVTEMYSTGSLLGLGRAAWNVLASRANGSGGQHRGRLRASDYISLIDNAVVCSHRRLIEAKYEHRRRLKGSSGLNEEESDVRSSESASTANLADGALALRTMGCTSLCVVKDVLGLQGEGLACVTFDGNGGAQLAGANLAR